MSEENFLETTKSKDFWLFFIFADIVALSFFGFLLFGSINDKFFNEEPDVTVASAPAQPQHEIAPLPQPTIQPVEEVSVPKPADAPKAQPQQVSTPSPVETLISSPKEEEEPVIMPDNKEQKQSVFIEANTSKTRKVTFKYYGEAKRVEIVSGFTMAKPLPLKKKGGEWEGTFVIYPGEYKYLLVVDGVQTLDPYAPKKDGRSFVSIK